MLPRSDSERTRWVKVFEHCMQSMVGVYRVQFGHPAMKAYMDMCEGWSEEKMRETFKRAIQSEKFCPTVATVKAYSTGIQEDDRPPVVVPYVQPKYTPEERADIERMKADLAKKFANAPWAQPLSGYYPKR